MPFKGTDKKAYAKASRGKTPEQRSKMYKEEKAKNERKMNKNNKSYFSLSGLFKSNTKQNRQLSPKIPTKPRLTNSTLKKQQYKIILNKQQIGKNIILDKTLEYLGEKVKDKIIDFAFDIIKENSSQEICRIIDTYKTIEKYIKIANNLYKIIIKIDEKTNNSSIKCELQNNNYANQFKYDQDYNHYKKVYDKYKNLNSFKTTEIKDLEEWCFGDDKQSADKLFELVKAGIKTATSYLYNKQDFENKTSKYSILTNWDKNQKLLIETIKTNIVQFKNVSPEHAYKEGEDNRSLQSWISLHKPFFTSRLAEKGENFSDNTQIVCEEFKVIKILN